MAHWMKHWSALVAIGCGLVALWLLPPDPPREFENYLPPTEAQALNVEFLTEARRLNSVLKRTRWLDSLSDVFANAQPDENGMLFSFPEGPLWDAGVKELLNRLPSARAHIVYEALAKVKAGFYSSDEIVAQAAQKLIDGGELDDLI